MTATISPPPTCRVAFKEWAGVCRALATGRQIVALRKGGIAEGPGGFSPEHAAFWLFPTRLHEGQQGLKETKDDPRPAADSVEIASFLRVAAVRRIENPDVLERIDDEHVWTAETIRSRFHYRTPGLWAMAVRAYSLPEPIAIPATEEQAGCKSWVELDVPLSTARLSPALGDAEFEARLSRLLRALEDRS